MQSNSPKDEKLLSRKRTRNSSKKKFKTPTITSTETSNRKTISDPKTKQTTSKLSDSQKKALTEKKKELKTETKSNPQITNKFKFNINSNSISSIQIINNSYSDLTKKCLMEELIIKNPDKTIKFNSSFSNDDAKELPNLTINFIKKSNPMVNATESEKLIDGTRNYQRLEELKFLKNLAIILEGNDCGSAAAWSTNSPKFIYVTSNKLGNSSKNYMQSYRQKKLMTSVIDDLLEDKINLRRFNRSKNLLEILLANIIFNSTRNASIIDPEEKPKFLKYLHIYLKGQRPKRIISKVLGIPRFILSPRNHTRIRRFVNAINDILNSTIYKKLIKDKYIIKVIHNDNVDVHAEIKMADYFLDDILEENRIEENKEKEIDNKIDVYIAPSRIPCEKCTYVFNEVNKMPINCFNFIVPLSAKAPKACKFELPFFLKDEDKKSNFTHILRGLKKQNNRVYTSKEKIHIQTQTSNKIDKGELRQLNTSYTGVATSDVSIENDKFIIDNLIEKVCSIFEFLKGYEDVDKILLERVKRIVNSEKEKKINL